MRYIIGNWKANMSLKEITQWIEEYKTMYKQLPQTAKIIIAPSALYLGMLKQVADDFNFELAAQDVDLIDKGAHTGQTANFQIKDFCKYCIVGHSELKEPRDIVLAKRDKCLEQNITPIVCFTNPDYATEFYKKGCFLAWEDPVNISQNGVYNAKDTSATTKGIEEIRKQLPAEAIVIYGGSVNGQNAAELAKINGLNGVLPGHASTLPKQLVQIAQQFQ